MKLYLIPLLTAFCFMAKAASFDPPQIPGWLQDGDVEVFDKDNLFNHINGASEFYFSYNFQKLWVTRYKKDEAEMTLEVYDHGDIVHAYGIYSMERPPEADVKDIGAQGYYEESILNFVAGRYYVKMNAYREPNAALGVLMSTARMVSERMADDPSLPEIVRAMPGDQLVPNSRQFVSNTFMGLEFLGSAYRAKYSNDDGELTLFVMERDSKSDIENLLLKYHEFAQTDVSVLSEGDYVIEDPFNGTIHLSWIGNYIIGFSGDDLKSLRERIAAEMERNLGV
ncbi:hypothetical protein DDZ16_01995 [Marinilabilia rubra]|uniref:DUF4367 domain-containing protein n=2 Tax=Marinilabilia rubra TaxID=2162893 RepID=A0A2U2BEI8_9BACT|nr:hypothetical protein DDZ16_01995 [Marinilabilia rubra]